MDPWFLQFVRPDSEIADVEGERVLGEARYNADGTFEFIRWNRPQHDGPASRALTCMRFWDEALVTGDAKTRLGDLIRGDLAYTAHFGGEACRHMGGRPGAALLHDAGAICGDEKRRTVGRG